MSVLIMFSDLSVCGESEMCHEEFNMHPIVIISSCMHVAISFFAVFIWDFSAGWSYSLEFYFPLPLATSLETQ